MAEDPVHVFVYGTLRSGFTNPGREVLTTHGKLVDEGTVPGRLRDLGAFPALIEPETSEDRVHGEIYELVHQPSLALDRLDRYEGARGDDPLPYERTRLTVARAGGGSMPAWTYVWQDDPTGREVPGGDWVAYLEDG